MAEKQAAEERARGDEVLQARERARLDFERTLAAAAGTDSATGQPISNSGRSHITFAPDGNLVISSDGSDSVRVWDAATANFRPANPR